MLVEPKGRTVQAMAAYIDLNCVRAGVARDPKEYRFCGYCEAVGGGKKARQGLQSVLGGGTWSECQAAYRKVLFGTGVGPREDSGSFTVEQFRAVLAQGGQLRLHEVLRLKVRYFSDGAVLGSRAFVALHLARYRARTGRREGLDVKPLPAVADWGEIATLRGLRGNALG